MRQGEPLGLGHAVLVTRNLVGDEPFAVILGDDVIDAQPPALRQMIDVFDEVQGPVLAVEQRAERRRELLRHHRRRGDQARASTGSRIWWRSRRRTRRRRTSRSSAATSSRRISFRRSRQRPSDRTGEIQLTNGLRRLLKVAPDLRLRIDGVRHDTGNKLGFLKAVVYFALRRPDLAEQVQPNTCAASICTQTLTK